MKNICNTCRYHREYKYQEDEYCSCLNKEALKYNNHINSYLSFTLQTDAKVCRFYEDYTETEFNVCGEKEKVKRMI